MGTNENLKKKYLADNELQFRMQMSNANKCCRFKIIIELENKLNLLCTLRACNLL